MSLVPTWHYRREAGGLQYYNTSSNTTMEEKIGGQDDLVFGGINNGETGKDAPPGHGTWYMVHGGTGRVVVEGSGGK